jgi:hypothetical protein
MPIETLSVYTHIRMYQAQSWLGEPDNGTAAYTLEKNLGYSAVYNNAYGMVDLSTVLVCPVDLMTYWDARAKITLSWWRSSSPYVPPLDAVRIC